MTAPSPSVAKAGRREVSEIVAGALEYPEGVRGMNAPLIVEDAEKDPRTAGHPAIGPWGWGAAPTAGSSDDTALLALRVPPRT